MNNQSRPVILPYDVLHTTMAYLSRRELIKISEVSTRFNSLIQREFATTPLLVLDGLRCTDPTFENRGDIKGDITWDLMSAETISIMPNFKFVSLSKKEIEQVVECKFVRFKIMAFYLGQKPTPLHLIKPLSHAWLNARFVMRVNEFCKEEEFLKLISSCREIQLDGNGTIYVISGHVLQGNCVGIDIIDNFEEPTYLTTRQLPMIPIIEWFCRPAFNCENQMVARKVRICTKWYPDRDHIRETIYELKQRFLCSKVPIGIFFSWQVIINDFTHNFYLGNFNVTNFTTKQRLTLSAGIFDFKLKTESI